MNSNSNKYHELLEQCAKDIRHGFCVTEAGGYLDAIFDEMLQQFIGLHMGDIYSLALTPEMTEAMAEVYQPSPDFSVERLLKKAFEEKVREISCYDDLLYARAQYQYPAKKIWYEWFYDASCNDLLSAWDEEIYNRINFLPYEVASDKLTTQQIRDIEKILWHMAIADDPNTVSKEVSVCEEDWWWCEEEIAQYVRKNQPDTFDLEDIYWHVAQEIALGIIDQNMATVEANRKIHKGE